MKRLINKIIILTLCVMSACRLKTTEEQKVAKPNAAPKLPVVKQNKNEQHEYVAQMTFVKYLDDGDYFQLLARKGDSTFSFINETDTSRNLNRGDRVQVTWKDGTITIPGDNDAEMPAQLLLAVKKTGDGSVSMFRRTYGKKLKYTWSPDEEFTSSYLDKVYLIAEYYLTKTKNPLLQAAIKNRDELTYSIESRERNNHSYKVIGIAPVGPNGSQIVQWLYVGEEDDHIYEYDLPEDKLVLFQ
ncbi:hypothetical protein KHS38_13205 [Mucilaginibacter sp. Bleaf8]|uniref:hypothetical protein n=1 Tax=Mucilaginibacter sp. Bleaf8 TaxID=2834430 RepID=UPI001BCD0E19|nr:hypothetical protein [Mucilaginibacter sp. Bleaf8]MBS7565363.1 hypothetical protein [Mucilaginibacter sp. Bleaf8]